MKRLTIVASIWCFLLCIGLDFFYFPNGLTFPDESRYLESARILLEKHEFWSTGRRAWEMPGTAVWFAVLGANLYVIRIAQALLLIGQAFMVGSIAGNIFKRDDAAAIATIITLFYPFFLFYQGVALSEPLFIFMLVAAFAALYSDRPLLAAVMFGLAGWVKPVLLALPAALFLIRWRPKTAIAAAAVWLAVLAPWAARNYLVLEAFVPFTTGANDNLYIGNNEHNPAGRGEWDKDVDRDFVVFANSLPELERSVAYGVVARSWMWENPGDTVRVDLKKLTAFWDVVPNADLGRGVAWISALSFGPVLLLSIIGALRWRQRNILPILALVAWFTALHFVVLGSLRYRLPIEPLLIVLASWPLACGWRFMICIRPSLATG